MCEGCRGGGGRGVSEALGCRGGGAGEEGAAGGGLGCRGGGAPRSLPLLLLLG